MELNRQSPCVRAGRLAALLLASAAPVAAYAQTAPAPAATAAPALAPVAAPASVVKSLNIEGSERLEPDTVRSYVNLRPGDRYDRETLDQALKDLYATELFADVTIRDNDGRLTVAVRENPVINRIVLEGNKRLKEDKIRPEIKLAPRQIFTRSKARADVARIIELYRRQGRFGANVEPMIVQLDQNRVDVVFEISEGPKSKVRQINILGNDKFSDGDLRKTMATKQSRPWRIFSSNDTYDPDRMAYDQQKMRQFYLQEGYADFRVASAVAELTPDNRDFVVTYVVEEGERYRFGEVKVDSKVRDLKPEVLQGMVTVGKGDWYDAQRIENIVDQMTEYAGLQGYAFADVRPNFQRDKDARTMTVTFEVAEAPRVYVERVDINGNTRTKDKVIRREFRLAEGDAFNSTKVKRSQDRIQSLGYFQERLEIEQKPGSAPDRVILEANVEEKPTGELQVSAGYSSLEKIILDLSIRERNFRGRGQEMRAGVSWSTYSKSVDLGFTEPYLFDRNIALGIDVFRKDYNSFNYIGSDRNTTYEQVTTGFQVRTGFPLTEYTSLSIRYGLSFDDVSLDERTFYTGGVCDPRIAGIYLCEAIGKRTTSSIGYSLAFDNLNNRRRPTKGHRAVLSQDVAGLGGSVKYIRSRVNAAKYWGLGQSGFIFSVQGEGGYITGLGGDGVRLTDRFYLGEPQMRGFDIRGIGPRVIRFPYDSNGVPIRDPDRTTDDALGGKVYYMGRLELEIPLGSGASEMGLRPSIFADVGAVWGVNNPFTPNPRQIPSVTDANGNLILSGYEEEFLGNTPSPRVSVGVGVNWNSPFGPFRIDFAKALKKHPGDDPKSFSFNVGTQF